MTNDPHIIYCDEDREPFNGVTGIDWVARKKELKEFYSALCSQEPGWVSSQLANEKADMELELEKYRYEAKKLVRKLEKASMFAPDTSHDKVRYQLQLSLAHAQEREKGLREMLKEECFTDADIDAALAKEDK